MHPKIVFHGRRGQLATAALCKDLFAWKLAVLLCILFQSFAAIAQAEPYILHRMAVLPYARINGMNDNGMVVGFHGSVDGKVGSPQQGFIYDHKGLIGAPQAVHSLNEWIPTPTGSNGSSCVGINNLNQVVGYFSDSSGKRVGYFLDLGTRSWDFLQKPTWSAVSYGVRINDASDVLVTSQNTVSQPTVYQADIVNVSNYTPVYVRSLGAVSNLADLNNLGQVTGTLANGSAAKIDSDGTVTTLPLNGGLRLNNLGVVGGTYTVDRQYRVARFFGGVLEPIADFCNGVYDINDQGDVAARMTSTGMGALFTDEVGWKSINELVTGAASANDWLFWTNSNTKDKTVCTLSNRINSAGLMAGVATYTSTTGKGKNAVTTSETRWYLIIPASAY